MQHMKSIGLVMIVKNESRSLEKCLSRAVKLVDGIYITDTGSTDNTVEIAKKYQAHVSVFEWNNDFAAARNYALAQSPCDWNLVLDADEYLISGTKKELQKFINSGEHIGAIRLHNSYREANGEISQSYEYITRFFPKGTLYEGRMHEQVVSSLPIVPLSIIFEHDGYLQEGKGERNLEILKEELQLNPDEPYLLYQIARTLWLMKDFGQADKYFEKFYLFVPDSGAGYRTSGIVSYLYNLLELKKYETGFQLIKKEKERLRAYADFHFACGTFYTQAIFADVHQYISYLPEIERSYQRCLEIGEVPEHESVIGNGSFKAAYNLGVWFEVNGNTKEALTYYRQALDGGYQPAAERIKQIR